MWLIGEGRNALLLAVCQALFWGALMIGITMSGLVGHALAENKALATLPAGLIGVVMIFVAGPASTLMQRLGRRAGFLIGAMAGLVGGGVSAAGIFGNDFVMFCAGNAILGVYQGFGQFYRLAATDGLPTERHGRAVSTVMAGAIAAALLAPTLSAWSKDLFAPVLFAGSFLAVSALSVLSVGIIIALKEPQGAKENSSNGGRPLGEIIRQPLFIVAIANAGVAHAVMILVMLATPIAMVACNFSVFDAATVIQWHVLGMFLPSFFSGLLADRFGAPRLAIAGAAILAMSAAVAASGIGFLHFGVALALLGLGWNFMYVSGTMMITASHRPEERGRVQGVAEMAIAVIATSASFLSGALLHNLGWSAVNIGAAPLLLIAAGMTVWYALRTSHGALTDAP
jgi:predicted MFS family arabinose efflux permease